MKRILMRAIRFYQKRISALFPARCRYYPTCSQYALEAISLHGILLGSLLAVRRLLRCNIFFPGGYDPVPTKKRK